jgi:hypothetical protein
MERHDTHIINFNSSSNPSSVIRELRVVIDNLLEIIIGEHLSQGVKFFPHHHNFKTRAAPQVRIVSTT